MIDGLLPYSLELLAQIAIFVILTLSLNIALGYSGLINLGHIAFWAVGAYTSALLTEAGIPFILAIIAAGIVASLLGAVIMYTTRNLKSDYLALATLGITFIVVTIALQWRSVTKGARGITGLMQPGLGIYQGDYLLVLIVISVICCYTMYKILKSPFGRLIQAIRDDEIGAKVLGKNTTLIKIKILALSAFFAGIAGSLYAHKLTVITPAPFNIEKLVVLLSMVIIGGLASFRGSIIGTILIIVLPESIRFFNIPSDIVGPLRQIIFALVLLIILLYRPRGIFGKVDLE